MSVGRRYLELCLRLGRHVEGLVDSYYGPSEIAERVAAEGLREPRVLADDANRLIDAADSAYLRAQLVGLGTVARKLAGDDIPYADEVERCYGVRPHRAAEADLAAAHRELDVVLPPGGTLAERYQRWREGNPIPVDRLPAVLEELNSRLRALTAERFGLPAGEDAYFDFVSGEPWAAYNFYLGDLRSRVAVNTDVDMNGSFAPDLVAHELYPGHHTEHAWKEQVLYRDSGKLEEGALMVGTPQSLVAEGIASLAFELAADDREAFSAEVLGAFGIDYDAEASVAIRRAREPLERVLGNAALLVHEDGAAPEEALDYLRRWGLVSAKRARHNLDFITHPIWRSYVTTYADGYQLARQWVDGDAARFKRLLTEQLTPADLS